MGWYVIVTEEMRALGLTGNQLFVFAAIAGYSQRGAGCFYGSLQDLADMCGTTKRTVISTLADLVAEGFIDKEPITRNGRAMYSYAVVPEVCEAIFSGCNNFTGQVKNFHRTGEKISPNNKDNNKDYISLSIEREARAREEKGGKFVKPTADEVAAYAAENGIVLDADHFVAHYTSNGWKVGKAPMKDWRAAVVAWSKREGEFRRPAAPAAAAQTAEDVAKHPNAVWDRLAKEGRI